MKDQLCTEDHFAFPEFYINFFSYETKKTIDIFNI